MNSQNDYSQYDKDGLPRKGYSFNAANDSPSGASSNFQPFNDHLNNQSHPQAFNNQVASQNQPGYPQRIQYSDSGLPYPGYNQKSMLAAALLAFFTGTLGIHNFYLGNTKRGVVQLGMSVGGWATSWLLIGLPVLGALYLWVMVEFILIVARGGDYATDSNGVPLD